MAVVLLTLVTLAYAGYNLFIKAAGDHVPATASTTILATFLLQFGAAVASTCFLAFLLVQGGHSFRLAAPAYAYAFVAGLCIGVAEVVYFYIFGGIGGMRPVPASLAIPIVVTGTVVVTVLVSALVFREALTPLQLVGAALIVAGIAVLFVGQGAGRAA